MILRVHRSVANVLVPKGFPVVSIPKKAFDLLQVSITLARVGFKEEEERFYKYSLIFSR